MKNSLKTYLFALVFGLLSIGSWAQSSGSSGIPCSLRVPDAFTPNNDNINDRFVINVAENCEIIKFSLQIFDRWGRTVYSSSSTDPNQAWDGTLDGSELRDGVYMYNLYVKMGSPGNPSAGENIEKMQGTVVLIR